MAIMITYVPIFCQSQYIPIRCTKFLIMLHIIYLPWFIWGSSKLFNVLVMHIFFLCWIPSTVSTCSLGTNSTCIPNSLRLVELTSECLTALERPRLLSNTLNGCVNRYCIVWYIDIHGSIFTFRGKQGVALDRYAK